jgi:hypothetical protein
MEYDHEEEHFCISAMTMVAIVAPPATESKHFMIVVGVFIAIGAVFLIPQIRKLRSKDH